MQDGIDRSCPVTGLRGWALICQPSPLMAKDDEWTLLLPSENSLQQKEIGSHWHIWKLCGGGL